MRKKKMVRAQMCLLLLQEESLSWAELPKGKNKQTNKQTTTKKKTLNFVIKASEDLSTA